MSFQSRIFHLDWWRLLSFKIPTRPKVTLSSTWSLPAFSTGSNPTMTPTPVDPCGYPTHLHAAIKMALLAEQAAIGWGLALKGFLSKEWVRVASYEIYDCQVTSLPKAPNKYACSSRNYTPLLLAFGKSATLFFMKKKSSLTMIVWLPSKFKSALSTKIVISSLLLTDTTVTVHSRTSYCQHDQCVVVGSGKFTVPALTNSKTIYDCELFHNSFFSTHTWHTSDISRIRIFISSGRVSSRTTYRIWVVLCSNTGACFSTSWKS